MNVQHLDHLNLTVVDFQETADWYHRIFGFKVVEKGIYSGEPWGVIKGGEAMLCIYQAPNRRTLLSEDASAGRALHMDHFALRIQNRALWEAVISKESVSVEYCGAYRWPHSWSWYIRDPSGYRIEVVLWDDGGPNF